MYSVSLKENVSIDYTASTAYSIYETIEEGGRDIAYFQGRFFCQGFDRTNEACIKDYIANHK